MRIIGPEMSDCPFCVKFNYDDNPDCGDAREWYDKILLETEEFVAVPALGQMVEGYLLIIPRAHVTCMGNLSADSFERLLAFELIVFSALGRLYGKPIVFEHGAVSRSQRAGCCVDHAHWHVVPTDFDISETLAQQFKGGCIEDYRAMRDLAQSAVPYLFFADNDGQMYLFEAPVVPRQHFRRWLAAGLGMRDKWDSGLFPFYGNIRSTIDKFQTFEDTPG